MYMSDLSIEAIGICQNKFSTKQLIALREIKEKNAKIVILRIRVYTYKNYAFSIAKVGESAERIDWTELLGWLSRSGGGIGWRDI